MKVSICIPTFNRAKHLSNCLQSIFLNKSRSKIDYEVCVSDNGSTDDTEDVVRRMQVNMAIKYHRNPENIGIPKNFLNVVEMADGDFVWLIGDDDLLLPHALTNLSKLLQTYNNVDFLYINSFHLTTEYVESFSQPFDTVNLPDNMIPFSSWLKSGKVMFMDLVDPKISFDFLGGMFLSVFRRKSWCMHANVLDEAAISDMRTFSHFDNTFPHVKIFAKAFAKSQAYFHAEPLSVCLTGAREWSPMYSFVHSVRLVESLSEYRKNGMPLLQFLRCKNFALNNFAADLALMLLNRKESGVVYTNPLKLIMQNCLFPNCYLSFFYYYARRIKSYMNVKHAQSEKDMSGLDKDISA